MLMVKALKIICLTWLLLAAHGSRAQTVLQGDSVYQGLQLGRDSLASVVARLGQHYHKKELFTRIHLLLRGGDGRQSDGHAFRLDGYALRYRSIGATFCVDEKTGQLFRIQLSRRAAVISARGIRPGAATFAMVLSRYGPSERATVSEGQLGVYVFSFDHKTYYTALRYPHITFISQNKPATGENLLVRRVQEIWLW